jgi:hypothetical protein
MAEEIIIFEHEEVSRTFTREADTTTFERIQVTVFNKEEVVRVFNEVIPNGA